MKKKTVALLLILSLAIGIFASPIIAAESDVPSIFINDTEWYKDAISPLISRGGHDYVPIDVFGMFDYISVTMPKADNILVHNIISNQYISILYSHRSAAVNGTIMNSMGVFMEEDTYYVDAEVVSEAIGVRIETVILSGGTHVFRIFDDSTEYGFYSLIEPYLSEESDGYTDEDDIEELPAGDPKIIYILCSQSGVGDNKPLFSANEILRLYGLNYTMFIYDPTRVSDIIHATMLGEYGIYSYYYGNKTVSEVIDSLNLQVKNITHRLTTVTLDVYGDNPPDGYHVVSVDFTVNGVLSAKYVYGQITEYFKTHDSCTLYLEDCWNSEQMIILLAGLDENKILTSNLAGSR